MNLLLIEKVGFKVVDNLAFNECCVSLIMFALKSKDAKVHYFAFALFKKATQWETNIFFELKPLPR